MKKLFLAAVCLMSGAAAITVAASEANAGIVCAASAQWDSCGTATAVKFGSHSKTMTRNCPVERDGSKMRIMHYGEWRTVYASDKSGYEYMFYSKNSEAWYFNL